MQIFLMLLAAAQIIFEALPISSSGHVSLLTQLAQYCGFVVPEQVRYVDEFLHLYTIIVVLVFFRNVWLPIAKHLWVIMRTLLAGNALRATQKKLLMILGKIFCMIVVTCVITAVGYFSIKEACAHSAWYLAPTTLLLGFAVTAIMLLLAGVRWPGLPVHKTTQQLVLLTLGVALAQCCAMLPGISRFAATTVAGLVLGLTPRRAVQWSWLIFVPLMGAAGLVHGIGGLLIKTHDYTVLEPLMLLTCIVAAIISYFCLAFVQRHFVQKQTWQLSLYMLLPIITLWFLQLKP